MTSVVDTFHELEAPISRWLQYFEGTQHLPARWYSVKMGGFNFVVLFSSDGAIDHETNDTNILLQEQIDWLNGELALGMPTVLLYHIWIEPPLESPEADAETELHPIFQAVIDHPGVVKAAFSGHGHGSGTRSSRESILKSGMPRLPISGRKGIPKRLCRR